MNWIQNMNRCVGPASWDKPREISLARSVPLARRREGEGVVPSLGTTERGGEGAMAPSHRVSEGTESAQRINRGGQ